MKKYTIKIRIFDATAEHNIYMRDIFASDEVEALDIAISDEVGNFQRGGYHAVNSSNYGDFAYTDLADDNNNYIFIECEII